MLVDGKVVLVTGAGGSIGKELVKRILQTSSPKMLVLLDICEYNLYSVNNLVDEVKPSQPVVYLIGDIRHEVVMDAVFQQYRPNFVFHVAALKHVPMMEIPHNIIEGVRTNILGTMNVARVAIKYGAEQFLMVSTDKAVNPSSIMGATKAYAEGYVQELREYPLGTKLVLVRFGNVIGSSGSVVPFFIDQVKKGGPVTVTHPDITRFMMSITEAVDLLLTASELAMKYDNAGGMFLLNMGVAIKIVDLAKQVIRDHGRWKNIDIVFTGLRPGEKLTEELTYDYETLEWAIPGKIFKVTPEKPVLGFLDGVKALKEACDDRDYDKVIDLIKAQVAYKA